MNEISKNKRGWRIVRRILVGLAMLATLVAIFYTEEDWRGKRAWENCKRDLEAQGMVLDWNKYIPSPVPDDQNFFTASTNILLRFKKAQTDAESKMASENPWLGIEYSTNFPTLDTTKTGPLLVANISILSPGTASRRPGTNSLVVTLNDPAAREQVRDLIQRTVGQSIDGAAGFQFSEFQLTNLQPARIVVQAETPPSISDLEALIPPDTVSQQPVPTTIPLHTANNIGRLHVEATSGDNTEFHVLLTGVRITAAADFLKWSDQFEPAFDKIREALKRPYAILPGDYSVPYLMPIIDFVTMRSVAQMLAQRAQCYFLLGEPDKALPEVILMHDICRILEKPPTGKPITMLDAMLNVAITGLYVNTIADGFRLHAWRAPQLTTLQEQLKAINLPPLVADAFQTGQASSTYTLETAPDDTVVGLINYPGSKRARVTLWKRLHDPVYLLLKLAPRGWVYQNMKNAVMLLRYEGFDLTNNLVFPGKTENAQREAKRALARWSPFNIWAMITVPNALKVVQTTAANQTLVNEAQIACALERYRLTHGEYPETLDTLVPQFIEKLPHDLIGGQPLHYRRTSDGKFLLYSVSWNGTDDGGVPGKDFSQGDWVWQN